jgi:sigma-B regulation protein RsbU (phosphoserine phosphatase)
MIITSSLTKQLSAFLSSMSRHGGIELCLTDEALRPLVCTPHFRLNTLSNAAGFDEALVRTVAVQQAASLRLFGEAGKAGSAKDHIESLLNLSADGVGYFIKNEAEVQMLSEELLERYQELHLLYEVIEDVSAVFDEHKICEIILNKALQSINVELGAVAFNEEGQLAVRLVERDARARGEYSESDCLLYAQEVMNSGSYLVLERPEGKISSVLGVPITVNNSVIGAMVLIGKAHGEMFTSADRISLGALAGYLGVAVTTTRLVLESRRAEALRREIEFAEKIQQSLLPHELPCFASLDIAAHCLPSAQVGGDLFGFLRLENQRWAVTVADVAGHGLGAAFIMASLRSILRSEAKSGMTASEILKNSNNLLSEDTRGNDVYATVFFAVYSERDNSLNFSNAGHPPPLLWKAASRDFCELHKGGMALGLFEDEEYENQTVILQAGDVLVIYTDGITEAKNANGVFYGEARLKDVIKDNARQSSQGLMEALLASLEQFQAGMHRRDDMTVLILKSSEIL